MFVLNEAVTVCVCTGLGNCMQEADILCMYVHVYIHSQVHKYVYLENEHHHCSLIIETHTIWNICMWLPESTVNHDGTNPIFRPYGLETFNRLEPFKAEASKSCIKNIFNEKKVNWIIDYSVTIKCSSDIFGKSWNIVLIDIYSFISYFCVIYLFLGSKSISFIYIV